MKGFPFGQNLGFPFGHQEIHEKANGVQNIYIQIMDRTGNWRTAAITMNDPGMINNCMHTAADAFPESRVRAINEDGNVVDIW